MAQSPDEYDADSAYQDAQNGYDQPRTDVPVVVEVDRCDEEDDDGF